MTRKDRWQPNEAWLADFYARTGKGAKGESTQRAPQAITEQSKIVRQATRDKRNKLERSFEAEVLYWHKLRGEIADYKSQAIRLQLANGVTYLPDYYVLGNDRSGTFIEIKGEKRNGRTIARDDAAVKIKIAAKEYPEFRFHLAWKSRSGEWRYQIVAETESEEI